MSSPTCQGEVFLRDQVLYSLGNGKIQRKNKKLRKKLGKLVARGRESKAIISAKGETEQFLGRTEIDKTHVGILMLKFFFFPFSLSSKEEKHFFSYLRSIYQRAEQ